MHIHVILLLCYIVILFFYVSLGPRQEIDDDNGDLDLFGYHSANSVHRSRKGVQAPSSGIAKNGRGRGKGRGNNR